MAVILSLVRQPTAAGQLGVVTMNAAQFIGVRLITLLSAILGDFITTSDCAQKPHTIREDNKRMA
jgi:hypothetical protein